MAGTNNVSLSKALPLAGVTPRVRFQLDSDKSPADYGHNAPGFADAEASIALKSLSAISTPAENGIAQGTVGLVRSSSENEKGALDSKKQGKAIADSLADETTFSGGIHSMLEDKSAAVHGASTAQNNADLEKEGVVCSVQLGDGLHQDPESCSSDSDCTDSLLQQSHIASMIESMRRRITAAEFQFAHAGYAARQGLKAVLD